MKFARHLAAFGMAGRRPANDTNTTSAPSYSTFDVGARYTTLLMEESPT